MKKRHLILPTVAMLSLLGCTDHSEIDRDSLVRNEYKSLDDCRKDWKDKEDCTQDSSSHLFMSHWYPYYIYQNEFMMGRYRGATGIYSESTGSFYSTSSVAEGVSSAGKVSISRGGFGSTGHASSGGSAGE